MIDTTMVRLTVVVFSFSNKKAPVAQAQREALLLNHQLRLV